MRRAVDVHLSVDSDGYLWRRASLARRSGDLYDDDDDGKGDVCGRYRVVDVYRGVTRERIFGFAGDSAHLSDVDALRGVFGIERVLVRAGHRPVRGRNHARTRGRGVLHHHGRDLARGDVR